MALSDPSTRMGCHARHACLVSALCLGIANAVAPTQQVSNIRFEDTNNDAGWISGTILWDPPADTAGIHNYGVLIFNQMDDITPVPALPGDFQGAWFLCDLGNTPHAPVGVNNLTISTLSAEQANFPRRGSAPVQPQNRRRYVWGHFHPIARGMGPDRYIAVACMNEQKEAGPTVVIPLYDKSSLLPVQHLDTITFTDTNAVLGVLDGRISWAPGIQGDFSMTTYYALLLANDDVGTDELTIGATNVPTFELNVSGLSRGARDFILIRGVNPNGVSSWTHSIRLFDSGPSAPSEGVTAVAFEDTDYRQGYVAGKVTWTPPNDEAPISSYRIFLSDQQGVGGVRVPADGYQVLVGTTEFLLPAYTLRTAQDYLQVYAENDKGMQALPTELAIVDRSGS